MTRLDLIPESEIRRLMAERDAAIREAAKWARECRYLQAALGKIVRHTRRMIDGEAGAHKDRAIAIDEAFALVPSTSETTEQREVGGK